MCQPTWSVWKIFFTFLFFLSAEKKTLLNLQIPVRPKILPPTVLKSSIKPQNGGKTANRASLQKARNHKTKFTKLCTTYLRRGEMKREERGSWPCFVTLFCSFVLFIFFFSFLENVITRGVTRQLLEFLINFYDHFSQNNSFIL